MRETLCRWGRQRPFHGEGWWPSVSLLAPSAPLATGFVPWGPGSGSRLGWWWKPQRLDQQGLDLAHLLLELFHFYLDVLHFFLHLINALVDPLLVSAYIIPHLFLKVIHLILHLVNALVHPVLTSAHLIFQFTSETTESTDEQAHASQAPATRASGCSQLARISGGRENIHQEGRSAPV